MKIHAVILATCLTIATCAVAEDQVTNEHWTIATAGDDYAPLFSLLQQSADAIPDEYASKEVQPVLDFRCAAGGGDMTFQIDWQRFISSFSTEAGFRVDGGKATWIKLSVDSSNKITLGKAADARKLLDQLGGGSTLNVEIAPYSESSVFVNFDISTLADGLDNLRAACQ